MKHFIQAKLPLIYQSIAYIKYYKDFLRNKKGLDYSDIAIVYPYNKKKLKI